MRAQSKSLCIKTQNMEARTQLLLGNKAEIGSIFQSDPDQFIPLVEQYRSGEAKIADSIHQELKQFVPGIGFDEIKAYRLD